MITSVAREVRWCRVHSSSLALLFVLKEHPLLQFSSPFPKGLIETITFSRPVSWEKLSLRATGQQVAYPSYLLACHSRLRLCPNCPPFVGHFFLLHAARKTSERLLTSPDLP